MIHFVSCAYFLIFHPWLLHFASQALKDPLQAFLLNKRLKTDGP